MRQENPGEALMARLVQRLSSWTIGLRREPGQTLSEYTVVLGVLIIAVGITVTLFATSVHTLLHTSIISILDGL
jgi:hypothetical protein